MKRKRPPFIAKDLTSPSSKYFDLHMYFGDRTAFSKTKFSRNTNEPEGLLELQNSSRRELFKTRNEGGLFQ